MYICIQNEIKIMIETAQKLLWLYGWVVESVILISI